MIARSLTAIAFAAASYLGAYAQTQAAPDGIDDAQIRPVDTLGLASGRIWAQTITADELREYAMVLASDSLQGRETGTEGQRMAADYIAAELRRAGVAPLPSAVADATTDDYFQSIAFERTSWNRVRLAIDGEELRHLRDFYAFPSDATEQTDRTDEVVFVGYGIHAPRYSDYAAADDLAGKTVIALAGEPRSREGLSQVTGLPDSSEWAADLDLKIEAARSRGVRSLLIVEPNIQRAIAGARARIIDNSMRVVDPATVGAVRDSFNVVHVSPKVLEKLAGKRRKKVVKARKRMSDKGVSRPVSLETDLALELDPVRSTLAGSNVLGYVRGSDPALADELVVVSAHYDHLGSRGESVFNGADDNASGTSTVLELAEAFATAKRVGRGPKRSVLLLLVSGEEKGLLGSEFYAANPVFPLENTVADVNIDMIGRYDEAHADTSAYIYVIGAGRISSDLHRANDAVARAYSGLDLDYTFDAEDDPNRFYYRSDHYNFAKNGVPSVFYFSGVHEDYHRPTDTPDKLDYEKMAKVGQHAFLLVWNLANRPGDLNREPLAGGTR